MSKQNTEIHKAKFRAVPKEIIFLITVVWLFTLGSLITVGLLTGFDDEHGKSTVCQMASILVPLLVYFGNTIVCYRLYNEAKYMRNEGYLRFYEIISLISKRNFGITSIYFVVIFAFYSFVLHNLQKKKKKGVATLSLTKFFLVGKKKG
ncbi:hypothetical protein RFI_16235 [Reticulomyxa filosa]|uniref:Uncharacterized protein n=1 Tax=Reticulomyxa filosa TaxID=46433 RepID=X6N5F7_RETFI|nr:hypothetical protein RFI_16235 [Reticulomyxa filosa]|eukprot:ETO20969.1 hypothetical protein RFI_16235 [Reticulomyxa filosa]